MRVIQHCLQTKGQNSKMPAIQHCLACSVTEYTRRCYNDLYMFPIACLRESTTLLAKENCSFPQKWNKTGTNITTALSIAFREPLVNDWFNLLSPKPYRSNILSHSLSQTHSPKPGLGLKQSVSASMESSVLWCSPWSM